MVARADRLHHRRPEGDVGDEVAVHDVDVDGARAAALGGGDVLAEAREVGGEDRRREDHWRRPAHVEGDRPPAA